MSWIGAKSIKTYEREDGKARVHILHRDDGRYSFHAEAEQESFGDIFWGPLEHSGIYDSAETAEQEATSLYPWLKPQVRRAPGANPDC
jgi:hypothetical protein